MRLNLMEDAKILAIAKDVGNFLAYMKLLGEVVIYNGGKTKY